VNQVTPAPNQAGSSAVNRAVVDLLEASLLLLGEQPLLQCFESGGGMVNRVVAISWKPHCCRSSGGQEEGWQPPSSHAAAAAAVAVEVKTKRRGGNLLAAEHAAAAGNCTLEGERRGGEGEG